MLNLPRLWLQHMHSQLYSYPSTLENLSSSPRVALQKTEQPEDMAKWLHWQTTHFGTAHCMMNFPVEHHSDRLQHRYPQGSSKTKRMKCKAKQVSLLLRYRHVSARREPRLSTTSTGCFCTCLQVTHVSKLRTVVCVHTSHNSCLCHLQTTNRSCPRHSRRVIQTNPTADFIVFLGQHQNSQPSFR